jgi:glycosyltransferase involved in cell wall biosynthesis
VVVYNGVQKEGEGVLPEALSTRSHPRIVTVGRLVPWKGIPGLIDAVSIARDEFPNISLTIVGDGPDRVTLEAYTDTRLQSAISFTGALSHADTLAVIGSSDVFVLNSTYEGLSHLLIEAASLGVPIVATSVGGNPEVVTDGVSGLLVPPGDPEALAKALKRMSTDSTLREKLRTGALESARTFTQEAMITGTIEALH